MPSQWNVIHDDDGGEDWYPPAEPGVYVVYGDGKLLYIGSASNMRRRFGGYQIRWSEPVQKLHTFWGYFDDLRIKYRTYRRYGEWLMAEARLIRRIRPPRNLRHVPRCEEVESA